MQNKISDNVRIFHILDAISEIENYTLGVDQISFISNSMMFNATLRQLEIIGEAANGLSDEFIKETISIQWARLIALRNIIIHEYFGVDDITIWNIVKNNIPELKEKLLLKK